MLARMEMVPKWVFENVSQILHFGWQIFEILQKCCCNTKFRQEMAFYLLEFFRLLFHKCRGHFIPLLKTLTTP